MSKTYTAQSVLPNHTWQYNFDEGGNICGLIISAEVNYGEMGMMEQRDIWPTLTPAQRAKIQIAYDLTKQWFNKQFV